MTQPPQRRVRLVIKSRQPGEAADGLRRIMAVAKGASIDASIELNLLESEMTGAAKDAALMHRVHRGVAGTLDELAAAVESRERDVKSGKQVPRLPSAMDARKSLVQRVEAFTKAGGRILIAVKALAEIIASLFPKG